MGITIDSYEVGSQNWTDGFAVEFEKRNGYNLLLLLSVMTGRVIDNAKASDQFLWDLRRTVADLIAEIYVGGLRDISHENGLRLWCENYGHWGFPGEFTIYGGYSDEVGGEFRVGQPLGKIECRAASSTGHIYGKRKIFAEAFTSKLSLESHPAVVDVASASGPVPPSQLALFYDRENQLNAESSAPISCTFTLSDGSRRNLVIEDNTETLAVDGPWKSTNADEKGFFVIQETRFNLPATFGKDKHVTLELG